jgi:RNA polymerase sporulation-specific sigma factor
MVDNYENLLDEDLVALSVKGDVLATEVLIKRYNGAVKQIARSYFIFGGDVEDLVQEGMLGMLKAIRAYNGATPFNAFAKLCIKNKILSAVKSSNASKHQALNSIVDLASVYGETEVENFFVDDTLDPESAFIEKEKQIEFYTKLEKILSPMEYDIYKYYIEGYNYNEIAEILKKSAKSVDNALTRAKKKIEKEFSN